MNLTQGESSTWPTVLVFAKRMEVKLELNRHKGNREGWLKDDPFELLKRLLEEARELDIEMRIAEVRIVEGQSNAHYSAERVADEAADVANFAMMIADFYAFRKQELKQ